MKYLVLLLSLFVGVSSYAAPAATQKAPQQTQQQTNKELKRFTDAVSVGFVGIKVSKENNADVLSFEYVIKNNSKRNIRSVYWASHYFQGNTKVLIQDVPAKFEKPLKVGASTSLTFSVPVANLPENVKQALASNKLSLSAQFQAKEIVFSNGSKITVK
ncbi:hypothetical protein A1D22_10560 [Pasteurellaceae bacterium LFhippo2]|nr:hypothetical protein [Pasteurellaceae bacterium LFhippo2]